MDERHQNLNANEMAEHIMGTPKSRSSVRIALGYNVHGAIGPHGLGLLNFGDSVYGSE
jgi:hypothetical protein